jgi:hypothetical protein
MDTKRMPPVVAAAAVVTAELVVFAVVVVVVPEVPDLTKKKNILEKNVFISLHSRLLARYTFPRDVQ